jgi:hypothetical protein
VASAGRAVVRDPRSLADPAEAAYRQRLLTEYAPARAAYGVADGTIRCEAAALEEFLTFAQVPAWQIERRMRTGSPASASGTRPRRPVGARPGRSICSSGSRSCAATVRSAAWPAVWSPRRSTRGIGPGTAGTSECACRPRARRCPGSSRPGARSARGAQVADRPPAVDRDQADAGASPDDAEANGERAREQAREASRRPDAEWREINAALCYQVTDNRRPKKRAGRGDGCGLIASYAEVADCVSQTALVARMRVDFCVFAHAASYFGNEDVKRMWLRAQARMVEHGRRTGGAERRGPAGSGLVGRGGER